MARERRARIEDVNELAVGMPDVTVDPGTERQRAYQVGGKSFMFFRTPRRDALDPETGERYEDVIVFWVPSEADKQALVQDTASPFFTTAHFDGHLSVLVRGSRIGELSRRELAEIIQDAWLSRASRRRAARWLASSRRTSEAVPDPAELPAAGTARARAGVGACASMATRPRGVGLHRPLRLRSAIGIRLAGKRASWIRSFSALCHAGPPSSAPAQPS